MFSVVEPTHRVIDLLHELELYRDRYRGVEVPEQVESLNLAISRRARRVATIRRQVTELLDEMERLDGEVTGLQKGYEAVLVDAIDRIREDHDEGWSPTPVVGYRMWEWRDGGLHGAWEQWRTVGKEAQCRRPGEVPHSNGACGRLGCGIYATKAIDPLLTPRIVPGVAGYAIGAVEMTGKVIEHELGYRAARAEVVHLVLVGPNGLSEVVRSDRLDQAFSDPEAAYAQGPHTRCGSDPVNHIQAMLDRRNRSWTSARRPE